MTWVLCLTNANKLQIISQSWHYDHFTIRRIKCIPDFKHVILKLCLNHMNNLKII